MACVERVRERADLRSNGWRLGGVGEHRALQVGWLRACTLDDIEQPAESFKERGV